MSGSDTTQTVCHLDTKICRNNQAVGNSGTSGKHNTKTPPTKEEISMSVIQAGARRAGGSTSERSHLAQCWLVRLLN